MTSESILVHLFTHNNWANLEIIEACAALTDEQLDAPPATAAMGSIRLTLWHLLSAQQSYLAQLTDGEREFDWQAPPPFDELRQAARTTGDGFLAVIRGQTSRSLQEPIHRDSYVFEPWVILVQVINHATEHREQIKSMCTALGVTPPHIDGWSFGRAAGAFTEPSA